MEIVIDIPKEIYDFVQNTSFVEDESTLFKQTNAERQKTLFLFDIIDAIRNGTPLPEHHGRLIEVTNQLEQELFTFQRYTGIDEAPYESATIITDNAPTIIEAYKESDSE